MVAYYLSRYDGTGAIHLGYSHMTAALKGLAIRLNVKDTTLKNWRDEFDAVTGRRQGWHQRPPRPSRQLVIDGYSGFTEEDLRKECLKAMKDLEVGYILLKDLNDLSLELKRSYDGEFDGAEIVLPEEFRAAFSALLVSRGHTATFLSTTTIVRKGTKTTYIPNQWFVAAAYMADLVRAIKTYQGHLAAVEPAFSNKSDRTLFYQGLKKQGEFPGDMRKRATALFARLTTNGQEVEVYVSRIVRFCIDYDWWFGDKTVEREDCYASPVLNLLGVVAASSGFIADMARDLAVEPSLVGFDKLLMEKVRSKHPARGSLKVGVNVIVYGAPGTGKSYRVEREFADTRLTRVVFHSEYTYYDFVGAYKPVPLYRLPMVPMKDAGGNELSCGEPAIDYKYVPGPFIRVLIDALRIPDTMHTLLIEEINRANAPAVFGEVFQLLDRRPDGRSVYRIVPAKELRDYLSSCGDVCDLVADGMYIPANMNIAATMNSADQGVFVLDSAFKRRWRVVYQKIDSSLAPHALTPITYAGKEFYWGHFVDALNQKLASSFRVEEDRLIGQFFIRPEELNDKDQAFGKLLLYLWDDVLRHRREFFATGVNKYSDLLEKYEADDVLGLLNHLIPIGREVPRALDIVGDIGEAEADAQQYIEEPGVPSN